MTKQLFGGGIDRKGGDEGVVAGLARVQGPSGASSRIW